ncbi:RagB/SusD family nutrient uptake outer membrane protein [Pedobacter frigoris]|uniref:RagB/SusD family nutrient uptake outer membrane protein n=1 Tax=Pedobacter frigoris TaxID=2571272 RepID=UPI002930902E|nr:RagB/SusD family nutrient uptake outer membrane protein [Pedobacter frigoris]
MKTNYKRLLCILGLLCVSVLSCKKEWLEAKSDKTQAVPATVKDFQAMLDDFNSINRTNLILNEVAADGHYYTQAGFNAMLPSLPEFQNVYAWTPITQYEVILGNNVPGYTNPYTDILTMNIILDELKKSKDQDRNGLEQVKAQALFNRGRLYYELAQSFAPPFKVATANTDLGLALRLSSDITEKSVRSTVMQTYNQIVSDLIAAKDVLPNFPDFLSRGSKSAALGMLAKVYLSMGDYVNAFNYANEYLKIKNTLINYSTLSTSANFIGVNQEVAFINRLLGYPQITTEYLIDQSLYDSYETNDLRRQIFFKTVPAGITFKGTYGKSIVDLFCGVATDEMYLIRAEGYARTGNLSAAMKDLNDLLRTRYAKNPDGSTKYLDQTATNEFDALTKILTERKKQLILRNVRWTDLRRLNQEPRFAVTLKRTIGGQTYTLEPNSDRYTFPFPIEIINASGMPQNPGW